MADPKPPKPPLVRPSEETFVGRVITTISSTATEPFQTTTVVSGPPDAARGRLYYMSPTWTIEKPPEPPSAAEPEQPPEPPPSPPPSEEPHALQPGGPKRPSRVRVISWEYKVALLVVALITLGAFGVGGYLTLQDTLPDHANDMLGYWKEIGMMGFGCFVGLISGKSI